MYVRRYFHRSLPSGPRSLALFVVDMISSRVVTREDVQTVVVQCIGHETAFDIVCTYDPDSIISSLTSRAALNVGVEMTLKEKVRIYM
jgi:hypothetical protein